MPTEGCRGAGEVSVRRSVTLTAIKQECLKKNVLRCLLKLCSESHMTSVGRLFQMTGAA